ncbi:MarR family winged helix-turn-helix transcriptional regulator [Paraburkholderia silvatlantica]|uniref:DNA-binding MarR family transcriptional regulator n=1 Tax=Paraburkholderia silvatlantica TaxID=321895 RepID=A0ABR6FHG1_9BURK|nr:MarR family transcriptional regulator [Paraburkholderia silvatlantica]MBB2926856.1 DNA-binding MarR family transcriptional regulator [Paraburkholderia silvatlantica]PVY37519.1 MarR family transcriptional regulator [Paraburkholderia silvatlantica]PXW42481.1 MarR family transcriptional regulator [Paraburkholderia silvatlantica]
MTESAQTPPPDIAASLAGDLRALVGQLRRRFREQAMLGDFTPSQMAVLQRLEREGPSTVSNLARAEGMRPQSMGTLIAPLEAAGHIGGAPDPNDGRQTLWSLTDTFREWLKEGRAARQDWLSRRIEARLSGAEQQQLAAAVELLKRLVAD